MTMPSQTAAPGPLTAYGQPFATISNVNASSTQTTFTVTATTDFPIQLQMDWWSQNDPTITVPGTAAPEAGPTTQHSFTVTLPAGNHTGYWFGYSFRLDANDTSGLQFRPFQGIVQIVGSRATRGPITPVRFYQFGGNPPPPANGGGSLPNMWGSGNWNTYTWMQYNPNAKAYPQ